MRILIEYDSSWRNSFLEDGEGALDVARKFVATSKSKEEPNVKDISMDTVLGVLSRLIGDKRRLNVAKSKDDFYFKDMDISFKDIPSKSVVWNEIVYLMNKSNKRPAKDTFFGIISEDEPLFFSEYAPTLWSVLDLSFEEVIDFIAKPVFDKKKGEVYPSQIVQRLKSDILAMDTFTLSEDLIVREHQKLEKELEKEEPNQTKIDKIKSDMDQIEQDAKKPDVEKFEIKLRGALNVLAENFPEQNYKSKSGAIYPSSLYAGALYLMLDEMKKNGIDVTPLITKRGGIKGFSKSGYNGGRTFLHSLAGNLPQTSKTPHKITKADGVLEITLDIDDSKAIELREMINDARVSSFYLGKKGLAYVSEILLQ